MNNKIPNFRRDLEASNTDTSNPAWVEVCKAWHGDCIVTNNFGNTADIKHGSDISISYMYDDNTREVQIKNVDGTYDAVCIEYAEQYWGGSMYPGWAFNTTHIADDLFYKFKNNTYLNIDFKALQKYVLGDMSPRQAVEHWKHSDVWTYFGDTADYQLRKTTYWFLLKIQHLKDLGIALGPYPFPLSR